MQFERRGFLRHLVTSITAIFGVGLAVEVTPVLSVGCVPAMEMFFLKSQVIVRESGLDPLDYLNMCLCDKWPNFTGFWRDPDSGRYVGLAYPRGICYPFKGAATKISVDASHTLCAEDVSMAFWIANKMISKATTGDYNGNI